LWLLFLGRHDAGFDGEPRESLPNLDEFDLREWSGSASVEL
jgi:hypothetical protein